MNNTRTSDGYRGYFRFHEQAQRTFDASRIAEAIAEDGRFTHAEVERAERALDVDPLERQTTFNGFD